MLIKPNKDSFYTFTHENNSSRQKNPGPIEKAPLLASHMDTFLNTSQFCNRSMPKSIPKIGKRSEGSPSHYFREDYPRFVYGSNQNHQRFGQMQSPLRTTSYDNQKQLPPLNISLEKTDIQYEQQKILPRDRLLELRKVSDNQVQFKLRQEEFRGLNQHYRIIQNLHRDEQRTYNPHDQYQIYKSTNQSIEFHNNDCKPKSNSFYELDRDWNSKKRVSQMNVTHQTEKNKAREEYLRYQDTRQRNYNLIQLTKS